MKPTSDGTTYRISILVCEDESVIALDLAMTLEEMGHRVLGPCGQLSEAMRVLETECPDIAVLDVSLRDGETFGLADRLTGQGVEIIFHSGGTEDDAIASRYPRAHICPKPMDPKMFAAMLSEAILSVRRRRAGTPVT